MPREHVHTDDAPQPSGSYSQAIRLGDLLFCAGQGPFDREGRLVGAGSVAEQVRQTLANLDTVARAAGGGLRDAVRVGVYLSSLDYFEEMDAVYREYFVEPLPARTTIQTDLVTFDVEIDAVISLAG